MEQLLLVVIHKVLPSFIMVAINRLWFFFSMSFAQKLDELGNETITILC